MSSLVPRPPLLFEVPGCDGVIRFLFRGSVLWVCDSLAVHSYKMSYVSPRINVQPPDDASSCRAADGDSEGAAGQAGRRPLT